MRRSVPFEALLFLPTFLVPLGATDWCLSFLEDGHPSPCAFAPFGGRVGLQLPPH